jgi:GTPase
MESRVMTEPAKQPEETTAVEAVSGADAPLATTPIGTTPISEQRCGFVSLLGETNAGKSTLVNRLVGTKVTIVSHKVQTTRMPIRGIAMVGNSQLVFIDTPGIFKPRRRLDRAMVSAAWGGAKDADAVVLLIDAQRHIDDDMRMMVEKLGQMKTTCFLALNKIDQVDKARLLTLSQELNAGVNFTATFMISALNGSGVDRLKAALAAAVPHGPWHYSADDVTDLPLRLLAAEITREKLYARLHDELPYATTVETTMWTDMKSKGVRIEQTIFVERDSQKSIVLGKAGRAIKQISMESRTELTEIMERPVHLFLFVKVRDGWEHDPERYRDMGLEFPNE